MNDYQNTKQLKNQELKDTTMYKNIHFCYIYKNKNLLKKTQRTNYLFLLSTSYCIHQNAGFEEPLELHCQHPSQPDNKLLVRINF